jgi:hypothetical protein
MLLRFGREGRAEEGGGGWVSEVVEGGVTIDIVKRRIRKEGRRWSKRLWYHIIKQKGISAITLRIESSVLFIEEWIHLTWIKQNLISTRRQKIQDEHMKQEGMVRYRKK